MKAFILAAGLGARLRPLTERQPKVMVEVGGRKILERTIEQLKAAGADDIMLNTHYFPEAIVNYFGSGGKWGVRIRYSHEPEILGTAGGLKNCEAYFKNEKEFLVVYGDNVYNAGFRKIIEQPLKCAAMMVLFDRDKSPNSGAAGGAAEIGDKGFIRGFREGQARPETPYINGGVYKFTPEIFEFIPPNVFCDFGQQVFPQMLAKRLPLQAYIISPKEAIFGVDTLEYLEKANKYFNDVRGRN